MALQWHASDLRNIQYDLKWIYLLIHLISLEKQSAEGLSLGFVGLWAVGDVLNLAGSIWAHLVPTTIMVGMYYIFSDVVIICEVLYYRTIRQVKGEEIEDEVTPLLADSEVSTIDPSQTSLLHEVAYNVSACLAVVLLGVLGWSISMMLIHDEGRPREPKEEDHLAVGPQVLGYTSAMLYLCARIPQILKNYRKKKTDGLALLFFIFSVFGNLTYAASILIYSQDMEYLVANIPWLLGSLGTLAFDFMILGQFLIYRHVQEEPEIEQSLINT